MKRKREVKLNEAQLPGIKTNFAQVPAMTREIPAPRVSSPAPTDVLTTQTPNLEIPPASAEASPLERLGAQGG